MLNNSAFLYKESLPQETDAQPQQQRGPRLSLVGNSSEYLMEKEQEACNRATD